MMVLPLIDCATTRWSETPDAARSMRIEVVVSGGMLRLMISDSDLGFEPDRTESAIRGTRERLAALFDGDAKLELSRPTEGGTRAVMELPLESKDEQSQAGIG